MQGKEFQINQRTLKEILILIIGKDIGEYLSRLLEEEKKACSKKERVIKEKKINLFI